MTTKIAGSILALLVVGGLALGQQLPPPRPRPELPSGPLAVPGSEELPIPQPALVGPGEPFPDAPETFPEEIYPPSLFWFGASYLNWWRRDDVFPALIVQGST